MLNGVHMRVYQYRKFEHKCHSDSLEDRGLVYYRTNKFRLPQIPMVVSLTRLKCSIPSTNSGHSTTMLSGAPPPPPFLLKMFSNTLAPPPTSSGCDDTHMPVSSMKSSRYIVPIKGLDLINGMLIKCMTT